MNLNPEAQQNFDMLKEFFRVPDTCSDPQAFLRKRRVLANTLYQATQSDVQVEPADAFPAKYDPVTYLRTSPDIDRFRTPDGVWYHANGIRDEIRSPKENLTKIPYNTYL